jgi:hypothetical protein
MFLAMKNVTKIFTQKIRKAKLAVGSNAKVGGLMYKLDHSRKNWLEGIGWLWSK